jgi:AraC-like DNA-binding protein
MKETALKDIKRMYMQLLTAKPPFFTAADYSIESFATDLGTNRSYASRFVNQELGVTFSTLLNKLRLAHFIKRKSETPQATITHLAKECGFNSTSNFCRVFKASIGTTPNKYRTSHVVDDLHYTGAAEALEVPYTEPVYTYIPHAQKCIDWETPREYFNQELKNS